MGLFKRKNSEGDHRGDGSTDGTPTTNVSPSSCSHAGSSVELTRTLIGKRMQIIYSCQRCGSNYTEYRSV